VPVSFGFIDTKKRIKNRRILKDWLYKCIIARGKQPGSIAIVLVSDTELLKINHQFLNRDYLTDIITFDYTNNFTISGDLFISMDRVFENAVTYNTTPNNELKRVIIHGILHLLGYYDATEKQKARMRKEEDEELKHVKDLIIL
jgi:rRNA maturation RNase YbeY